MATIQVKHVPPQTHAVLTARADAAGQSLQEYLLAQFVAQAAAPTLDEVLSRAGAHTGGSAGFDAVVSVLRADRNQH